MQELARNTPEQLAKEWCNKYSFCVISLFFHVVFNYLYDLLGVW